LLLHLLPLTLSSMFFLLTSRLPPRSTLFPYTTLFRSMSLQYAAGSPARACGTRQGRSWPMARSGGLVTMAGQAHSFRTCPQSCRSEEHTSELQSRENLVCRLLLEKKKHTQKMKYIYDI